MPLQAPNVNFVDPGTPYSDAAGMFLRSMQAAHQMRLERQRQQFAEQQQADTVRHQKALEEQNKNELALRTRAEDRATATDKRAADAEHLKNENEADDATEARLRIDDLSGANRVRARYGQEPLVRQEPIVDVNTLPDAAEVAATRPTPEPPPVPTAEQQSDRDFAQQSRGGHGMIAMLSALAAKRGAPTPTPQDAARADLESAGIKPEAPRAPASDQEIANIMASSLKAGRARGDAFLREQGEMGATPTYVDTSTGQKFQPGRADEFQTRQASEAADRLIRTPPGMYPPEVIRTAAEMVRSRAVPIPKTQEEVHYLMNQVMNREEWAAQQKRAETVAAGQGARARQSAGNIAHDNEVQDAKYTQDQIRDLAKRYGVTDEYKNMVAQKQAMLNIQGNGIQQAGAMFKLARSYQGSGVLSNQDMNAILNRSGLLARFESWLQGKDNGQLSDREAATFKHAIQENLAAARRNYEAGRDAVNRLIHGSDRIIQRSQDKALSTYHALFGDDVDDIVKRALAK